ncbi:MAG: rhomboid family intramembrane serine protease [Leptospirales bacterium]|nr:rhomboid family intramembrane serine protease [Leptospirales bacterium]
MQWLRRLPVTCFVSLLALGGLALFQYWRFSGGVEREDLLLSQWAFSMDGFWYERRIWQPLSYLFAGDNALRVVLQLFAFSLAAIILEPAQGSLRFVALCIASSAAGLGLFAVMAAPEQWVSGMDGILGGLLMVLAIYRPADRTLLFFAIPASAFLAAAALLAMDLALTGLAGGSPWAVLGGALGGFLYARFALQMRREELAWSAFRRRLAARKDKLRASEWQAPTGDRAATSTGNSQPGAVDSLKPDAARLDARRAALDQIRRSDAPAESGRPPADEAEKSKGATQAGTEGAPGDRQGGPKLRYDPAAGTFRLE